VLVVIWVWQRLYIHFVDNDLAEENKSDKGFKIRPLIIKINMKFQQIFEKQHSIDEIIIKYFGRHGLKQFIRGKSIRFGYKFWAVFFKWILLQL
jgi:hypothetical protein